MTESTPIIRQYQLGPMANFVYLLGDPETRHCAIIDPAWDVDFLIKQIRREGLTLSSILVTHGHHDHINGVIPLRDQLPVPVVMSRYDPTEIPMDPNDIQMVDDDEEIQIGRLSVRCLYTPGHSRGSQCFLVESALFSGDTLFVDGCGRCNFADSNLDEMYCSLFKKILKLPPETTIYPGHHYGKKPVDSLANQKLSNRFLTCETKDQFIRKRKGLSLVN